MKNKIYYLKPFIWLIFIALFLSACEDELTDDVGIAEAIEGQWVVEETSVLLGEDRYGVYIDIFPDDSSSVRISNFYSIGYDYDVIGDISDSRIELRPNQQVGGYEIISGTGRITDDYQNIDWDYKVDDGSGDIDNVTAVYTKE
ncbi:MAG: hypothetical protein ACQESJ_10425 [Bacteroidota bacterium]